MVYVARYKQYVTSACNFGKPRYENSTTFPHVPPAAKKAALQAEVKKHVETGFALYTDFLHSYEDLASQYARKIVDHAVEYVNNPWPTF